LNLAELQILKN